MKFLLFGTPIARKLEFSSRATGIVRKKDKIIAPLAMLSPEGFEATGGRRNYVVDVVLPEDACLERALSLPLMSPARTRQAVRLNTLQETPFSEEDVLWSITRRNDGEVVQHIYRRNDADTLITRLERCGLQVRRLLVGSTTAVPLLDRINSLTRRYKLWNDLNALLLLGCVGLSSFLFLRPALVSQDALRTLTPEVEALRHEAVALRGKISEAEVAGEEKGAFVRAVSDQVLLVDIIRELTIKLPDSVWLSNVQRNGDEVIISGTISGSAAELVLLLAQSKLLIDPRLSGPVSRGQVPGTENFEIAASVGDTV